MTRLSLHAPIFLEFMTLTVKMFVKIIANKLSIVVWLYGTARNCTD